MRSVLAAALAVLLLGAAMGPHVHLGPHGDHDCVACQARGAEEAHSETPDVIPVRVRFVEVVLEPVVGAPPTGAPQGAVPGQSPPMRG
jgi:hypothetical protein